MKLEKHWSNFSTLNAIYCIFQCISWPLKSEESLQKLHDLNTHTIQNFNGHLHFIQSNSNKLATDQ